MPAIGPAVAVEGRCDVSFADVAGCEAAKAELREAISFLSSPDKLTAVGATPPRGLLLHGPSGSGKTLLARAAASEAAVPFLRASGCQFISEWAGEGAAKVRQMFAQAKEQAPCVLFIDDLHALGRRGEPGNRGHAEPTSN
jgi:cell division protease FtsH